MPSEVRAGLIALLLVVFAAAIGVVVGVRARPAPAPAPSVAVAVAPTATPVDPAEVERRAFAQPLSSGCATETGVWLFADGGAAIRFDGRAWTMPDPTLRSLTAAACRAGTAVAVGRGGSVLTADDDRRELRADRVGMDDLSAIAVLSDGSLAVGAGGLVLRQAPLGWSALATGITDDLYAVALAARAVAPGRARSWVAGAGGATYRLIETGWQRVPAPTTATLRAVLAQGDEALAAGDAGTLLRFTGSWAPVPVGTTAGLRAIALVDAATAWVVGERGTVLAISDDTVRPVDLGTTCTLRAIFTQPGATWIVGSDDVHGSAWRITPTGTQRWGSC